MKIDATQVITHVREVLKDVDVKDPQGNIVGKRQEMQPHAENLRDYLADLERRLEAHEKWLLHHDNRHQNAENQIASANGMIADIRMARRQEKKSELTPDEVLDVKG